MKKICCLLVAVPALAFAEVGKVSEVGSGTRIGKDKKSEELKVGTLVQLEDTLKATKGVLKFELNDGSVIAINEGSELKVAKAEFEGNERKGDGFLGFLKSGSLWTNVKKAVGGAPFQVETERAVAGVRGTIFRIDASELVKGAKVSIVHVHDGIVRVNPSAELKKQMKKGVKKATPGERKQVAGPTEISADEWEKRFVDLQANQQVIVGADLWEQAELDQKTRDDAFSKWINGQPK
ncbi:MAG: FecR domain-containing protein [Myxococcaceae bacterium]|nr:FecR domain-containing protein [Myxococcaceae bacterium]